MLLQHLRENRNESDSALYVSVDNMWLNAQELYELAQHHVRHGALAVHGGKGVYSGAFLSAAQVAGIGTMRRSITKLISERLIYRHNDEYKFFNPFFARWLADRKTVLAACLQNGNNSWMKSKAKMLEFDTICGEGKN